MPDFGGDAETFRVEAREWLAQNFPPSMKGVDLAMTVDEPIGDASIVPIVAGCLDLDLLEKLTARLIAHARAEDLTPDGTPRVALDTGSVRDLIVANAAALFSGPRGLASWLRRREFGGPVGSVSLPLDTGSSTDSIPAHLRRAVILRDRHCAAPGCDQPPAACQVHHIRPRKLGGITRLQNLLLLCSFHHLIAVQAIYRSRLLTLA